MPRLGHHILPDIVAYHQALLRQQVFLFQQLPVVIRVGLAEPGIFVGGDAQKFLRLQSCPPQAAVGGNGREQGIGSKNRIQPHVPNRAHRFGCPGVKAAAVAHLLKFPQVKLGSANPRPAGHPVLELG